MNIKALMEKRADLLEKLENMFKTCETENRVLNADEKTAYEAVESEIRDIDEMLDKAEKLDAMKVEEVRKQVEKENPILVEERAFVDYVMGTRSGEQNITMGNNGAIIPTTIANRIIKTVHDVCPILAGATQYALPGTVKIPVWGNANSTHNINVAFASEFSEIVADAGQFTSKDLGGYLAGALTLIGRSVENSGAFSVTAFIVQEFAEEIARFIEGVLLTGAGHSASPARPEGALLTTNTVTASATNKVTFDELIEVQSKVKQVYQNGAAWVMNPATFLEVKKLKDGEGRYILNFDPSAEFPYTVLGKPVYLSDNMPTLAASAKTVLYGNFAGMSVNFRENISIEVLREKYATQHAIGVVAWFEFDSVVSDVQQLAVLVQHA